MSNGVREIEYKRKLLAKTPEVDIWLVHGKKVRHDHIEFVEGGHDLVYKWMPHKEVWIDDALHPDEYIPVMIHELYERGLMKQGLSYHKAHDRANLVESRVRRNHENPKAALARHGFKPYYCHKCKDWHAMKDKVYESHLKYIND